ncbi:integrase [Aerococcus urinaehominis]|uniref:Integrase n=1 Tax=Aerococcus urinaehominis TaxID=128944 RepID=A0A0X8FJQ8_9LACT|nr:tyrosine-type recombinase/integrase [Aerococcus urinaehominis]AMB98598.1 integrase [Aerococcus urinaehominis]SDL76293.1 integrase/recombinase XerC [Aerococcus urinaehominis]
MSQTDPHKEFNGWEFYQAYADYLQQKQASTRQAYLKNIRPFLYYLAGHGISQPTYHDAERYFDDLINHPKDVYQLVNQIDPDELNQADRQALDHFRYKDRTIRSYRNMLNQFFKWLAREGLYENIIAKADSRIPVPHGHAKDALDIEDVNKLLDYLVAKSDDLTGKRDYAIILTALTTGLRTIELSRANYGDIQKRGTNTVIYVQGKGHRERDDFVILPRHTKEVIRDYTNSREAAGLMVNQDLAPLFASHGNRNKGGRMTTRSISRLVAKAFEAVGIKSNKITPHSLRHTAATLSLINGGNLRETQKMLRHSSVRTTEIYAQDLDEDKNMSTQLVEDLIQSSRNDLEIADDLDLAGQDLV